MLLGGPPVIPRGAEAVQDLFTYTARRQTVYNRRLATAANVMVKEHSNPTTHLVKCMVDLAHILVKISTNVNKPDDEVSLLDKSSISLELEEQLVAWRSRLPPHLDFDTSSLDESELMTKQKIVLKLRLSPIPVL